METIKVTQIVDKYVYKDLSGKHSVYPRKEEEKNTFEIDGETLDNCFAIYFKDYSNRYKYCNDIHFVLDSETQVKYQKWISNVNNYIRNGGDMW